MAPKTIIEIRAELANLQHAERQASEQLIAIRNQIVFAQWALGELPEPETSKQQVDPPDEPIKEPTDDGGNQSTG